jgi:glycosyltransferase involved in cell wall biosynthesis
MVTGHERDAPSVSVIMNCLNCSQYVQDAIESVYAQTFPDWEIIFWDNASTDSSGEIAQRYNGRLRYFRGQQTVPLGGARNLALQQARGEFVAFLDCDDLWLPEKLERQLPLFDDPQVGLVYSNSIYFNDRSQRSRLLYRTGTPPRGSVFGPLLSRYFLCLGTVVIRRATLRGLAEWFDSRFNLAEEADLFIRIAHDWNADYVPRALAKWRIHPQSWTWTRGHLLAKELSLMLEKYEALYENFDSAYGTEITRMRARIAYYEALEDWKHGRNGQARRRIRSYLRTSPRLFLPYIFSFLPFPVYETLLRSLLRAA